MTVDSTPPGDSKTQPQSSTSSPEDELGGRMTFIEHLEELRRRIVVALLTVVGCFLTIYSTSSEPLKEFFTEPLISVLAQTNSKLLITGIAEGFVFDLKLSIMAAIFISSPMIFYQIWAFVAPGLYKNERRYVGPFIIFTTLFFFAGAAFFYFMVFPMAAQFFASFAVEGKIEWMPKLNDVFSFVMMMVLAFGSIFEMPIIVFILARLHIVTAGFLQRNLKYAVVIILIVAAVITPPDVISQMLLAGPMIILYEISVLVAYVFGPREPKADPDLNSTSG